MANDTILYQIGKAIGKAFNKIVYNKKQFIYVYNQNNNVDITLKDVLYKLNTKSNVILNINVVDNNQKNINIDNNLIFTDDKYRIINYMLDPTSKYLNTYNHIKFNFNFSNKNKLIIDNCYFHITGVVFNINFDYTDISNAPINIFESKVIFEDCYFMYSGTNVNNPITYINAKKSEIEFKKCGVINGNIVNLINGIGDYYNLIYPLTFDNNNVFNFNNSVSNNNINITTSTTKILQY